MTHTIFKELIKAQYLMSSNEAVNIELPSRPLTHKEQNALRYVTGYVMRKLQEQIQSSSHAKKDEMIFLLMECAGDELDSDGGTETWMNMIDRGGLCHVNDQIYKPCLHWNWIECTFNPVCFNAHPSQINLL